MEAYGLGQLLDIPTEQAREILDSYFEGFHPFKLGCGQPCPSYYAFRARGFPSRGMSPEEIFEIGFEHYVSICLSLASAYR
jgi:hypothetical protein